jgi:signal transduction histidine kinase/ligand-binding sensor domain-containing protein
MQRTLFLLACFFICVGSFAQQYSFVRFTNENGLSNNVVYATYQDSKGFLWIATHDGLNRYDGYEFKKFLHSPFNKKSLAGNMTIAMAEDDEGRLWILTNTHLHLYNDKDESFERYALPVGTINHSNQSASKMINGTRRFLLLNLFNGLFVFDKINKRFGPIGLDTKTKEKTDLFNFPFFKDNEGNILIGAGSSKGVLWFDSTTVRLTKNLPSFYLAVKWQNEMVTSLYVSKTNHLIYCTQNGNQFSLVSRTGKKHFLLNRSVSGATVFIESIKEDESGNIWIAYGNRLFEYRPDSGSVIDVSKNLYATSAGDNFIIKDICIDNFSNLWLGLYEAGLLKASVRKSLFINFAINKTGGYKLPYSSIYGLIKNPDETIIVRYFGTQMASLIDAARRKIIVREFKFNPNDTITIKKLFPQFRQVQSSVPFYKYFDASTRLTFNNGQFGLYKDSEQDFWAVNFNEFRRVKDDRIFNIGDHINCFYEGDNHTFWIGSDGSGLLELNYKTGAIKKFLPSETDRQSISSQFVNVIVPDGKKGLWLATRYGLNYFNLSTRRFKLYSEENGLCNNTIYTMEKDQEGKLWLGTSNGLSCYDPHSNEFSNYSRNNGLVNSEYNRNGNVILSNGWILMGGTEGIDVIIPDSIRRRNETGKKFPPLRITAFRSADSSFFSFVDPIQLKHQQNNISISFAALDFTQPFNNKYLWKLEPIDKKWTYGLGRHDVNYAGLPPGHYTFRVKAAGASGIWSSNETSFSFVIIAPWWRSWWALLLLIAAGVGMLTGMLRLYYYGKFKKQLQQQKIILEKQQAIEKERTRIATDMHDDLGSGLSRIKFLSETIGIKKQQQQPIEEEVTKIKDYSREMIDKMGEIVWALNERNDSLSDLIAYTRAYAMEYLSQNGIECKVEMPVHLDTCFLSGEFRRNIFLSVKEVLHNIVKHAQASHVTIVIQTGKKLIIKVKDNGSGFDLSAVRAFSNGLYNIEKRMKDIGGISKIESTDGTTVLLTVPLPD